MILPIFDYSDCIYDCLTQYDVHQLQKLQNCAMRNILQCDSREHISDMHSELNLLPLEKRRKFHCLNETYKIMHSLSPKYLSVKYTLVSDIHQRTRSSTSMILYNKKCRLECTKRNFVYRSVLCWNALPEHIKQSSSLNEFKGLVLNWLKTGSV